MTLLVVQNSSAPVILTGITKLQFAQDVNFAYAAAASVVKEYTEQSMGVITLNLMNVAYFREWA